MKAPTLLALLLAVATLVAAADVGHGAVGSLSERVERTLHDGAVEAEASAGAAASRANLPGRRLAWPDAPRAVGAWTDGPATPPPEA